MNDKRLALLYKKFLLLNKKMKIFLKYVKEYNSKKKKVWGKKRYNSKFTKQLTVNKHLKKIDFY